jgi:hypothetical protein
LDDDHHFDEKASIAPEPLNDDAFDDEPFAEDAAAASKPKAQNDASLEGDDMFAHEAPPREPTPSAEAEADPAALIREQGADPIAMQRIAALNRALISLTMAMDLRSGMQKIARSLADAGLLHGLVVQVDGTNLKPLHAWRTQDQKTSVDDQNLEAFMTADLKSVLAKDSPAWSALAPMPNIPFAAAWRRAGQSVMVAKTARATGKLAVVAAWTEVSGKDETLREVAFDIFAKLALKR